MRTFVTFFKSLFLFSFFANSLFSQKYNFKNYAIENGLVQSSVQTIVQDDKGYMWLGTEAGLNKFNGISFSLYTKKDGLAENTVSCSFKDTDGTIYFGHQGGSISVLSKDDKIHQLTLPGNEIIKSRIHDILIDSEKNLWIATLGNGLYKIKGNTLKNYNYNNDSIGNSVFSVIEDDYKGIWIASDNGTYKLSNNKIIKLNLPPHASYSLLKDKQHNIWIGTNLYGAYFISASEVKMIGNAPVKYKNISTNEGLPFVTVFSLGEDSRGNIWAGSYDAGVAKINYDAEHNKVTIKKIFKDNGLPNQSIYDIKEDYEKNIWLGTLGGACVIRPDDEKFELYNANERKLNSNQVWGITKSKNICWVSTDQGLNMLEFNSNGELIKTKSYTTIQKVIKDAFIASLFQDSAGNLYCGTKGGLAFLPAGTEKFQMIDLTSQTVSSIAKDKSGKLWIGTWDGAFWYNPTTKEKEKFSTDNILKSNVVNKIIVDSKNNKWMATEGGLTKLSPDGKNITYNKLTGLKSDIIYCITEDLEGNIWFGTPEAGIYKYDGVVFKNFNTQNGFSSDNIYSVISDNQNNIWVGTSSGVDKFDQTTLKVKHYGKTEGFLGVETNLNAAYKDEEGKLWFGTVNGLMKYNPEKDIKNTIEPLTYIAGIKAFLKDTINLDQNEISYKQNHLTFNFIGISLSMPENVRYQYTLEGFDEDWSPVTNKTEVTYSNIPPGEYNFKVRACNSDDVWNKEAVSYSFTITPPFWKTKWFIILCIVITVAIIYSYINIRTRKLEKAKLVLEEQVKERTAEVVHQKQEIEQKNKDITDSINYAKRIQLALLPVKQEIQQKFADSFILYRPRDIVSGDLYWFSAVNDKTMIAVVDCTGHGVPGAFMSIVANSSLNEIVNEKGITEPDKVLYALDEKVTLTLKQGSGDSETRDGMDVSFCSFDTKTNTLEYCGANRPLIIVRNGELRKIKGSTFPVGSYNDNTKVFTKHEIALEKNDCIYIFSDGYADQFGGPKGKKFMSKKFEELIMEIQNISMSKQEERFKSALSNWQGGLESVDDILVIGLKV